MASQPSVSDPEPMTYLCRASCGCIRALVIDSPDDRRRVAAVVSEGIKRGETIDRVPTSAVRDGTYWLGHCEKCRPAKQEPLGL